MAFLFEPALLVFTLPLLLAALLCFVAAGGLLDVEALDFGADVEADADLGADTSGGMLHLMGLGLVPLSLSLTVLLFSFGWIGLALVSLFGSGLAGLLGSAVAASLALAVPAFLGAAAVTGPFARLLAPLFQDHGKAERAEALVGQPGVLTTGSVDAGFGAATVQVPGGGRVDVSARATREHQPLLAYGDRVLLYDYDPGEGVYFVAPYDDDLPA